MMSARQRALAVAAVAGLVFSVDVVASVLGQDRVKLLGIVDQAVRAGLIIRGRGSGRYAWSHPLLRAVVYDDIGVAARVRLHERVGDALEAALASGHDVELAAVSFHYLKAAAGGTAAKAVSYAERAAQQAMAALGYEEAARLYDRALEACRLDPAVADRGQLLLGAGAARAASGDLAGARQAFLWAAEHARRTGGPTELASAALGLSGAGFEVALPRGAEQASGRGAAGTRGPRADAAVAAERPPGGGLVARRRGRAASRAERVGGRSGRPGRRRCGPRCRLGGPLRRARRSREASTGEPETPPKSCGPPGRRPSRAWS